MKKMFISMLLMAVLSPVSAQIVSSQSERVIVTKEPKVKKEKKPRTVKFLVKGGIGGDFEEDNLFGYEASFGIAMPVGKKGLLWMPEIGFMSRGHNSFIDLSGYKETSGKIFTPQISPINFGWKLRMNKNVSFLPVVGLYAGYSFGGDSHCYDYESYDDKRQAYYGGDWAYHTVEKRETINCGFELGANIGLNFIINDRFLLGIQSHFGFMPRKDNISYYYQYHSYTNGILNNDWNTEEYDESHRLKKLMFTLGIMF